MSTTISSDFGIFPPEVPVEIFGGTFLRGQSSDTHRARIAVFDFEINEDAPIGHMHGGTTTHAEATAWLNGYRAAAAQAEARGRARLQQELRSLLGAA